MKVKSKRKETKKNKWVIERKRQREKGKRRRREN